VSLGLQVQSEVEAAIKGLADEPRPASATKLVGSTPVWRLRVGDYRVGYIIQEAAAVVTITRIGHRREVYDR